MRLRSLTIQGFKTFVQRTSVEFDAGITAIVGPNGSGKSNLADAFRWTMGEQSIRALRGRRTEDVLFAGGQGRPPAGFAEVSLLFDATSPNGRVGLDLPFSEVSIGRRAYRSGENEYFLNRDRVRLRDISDVFGQVGLDLDGFAVVGQGTVDSALSLRPSDRRALVEQAAGTGYLQSRLDESQSRLDQTRQNLERVSDLLAELTPRLKNLERQAKLARERESIEHELWQLVMRWYAHRLTNPIARIAGLRPDYEGLSQVHSLATAGLQAHRQEVETCTELLADAERNLRDALATQTVARERQVREAREIADGEQRLKLLSTRWTELVAGVDHWTAAVADERSGLAELTARRKDLTSLLVELVERLGVHEKELQTWSALRRDLHERVAASRKRVAEAERNAAATAARRQALEDRQGQLTRLLAERADQTQSLESDIASNQTVIKTRQENLQAALSSFEEAESNRRQADVDRQDAVKRLDAANAALTRIDREAQVAKARVDALESVEASGSGFFPGVRAIVRASSAASPPPFRIVGVVSRLLEVPAEYELAVEVALGGRSQDIVVDRWSDAEAAIAFLKSTNAGRATFLPLDVLRPMRVTDHPSGPGILGVGSSLVTTEPKLRVVCDFLLGQTLVVEDLNVARRVLGKVAGGWQIVTRDGEVARSSGAVTGGAPPTTRGALARYRELRDVRRDAATLAGRRAEAAASHTAARADVDRHDIRVADLQRQVAAQRDRRVRLASDLADTEGRGRRLLDQRTWEAKELSRVEGELASILVRIRDHGDQVKNGESERVGAVDLLQSAEDALRQFLSDTRDLETVVRSEKSDRVILTDQLGVLDRDEGRQRSRLHSAEARLNESTRLRDEAVMDIETMSDRLETLRRTLIDSQSLLVDADAKVTDGQMSLAFRRGQREAAAAKQSALDGELQSSRGQLQAIEKAIDEATVELHGIRQQLTLEVGPPEEPLGDGGYLTVTLPSGVRAVEEIISLADSDRVRDRIATLKSRMKVLPAGTDIVAEYDALRERIDSLTTQSADLARTAETLANAIGETRATMQSRFEATFADVSARFSQRFADLFGGGTARLVVESDGDSAGVDVFAQPPGKRSQNLATLSGGERALTAAALLFSLIEANPPPFCVLDEVDAALDESNVTRFAGCLRELTARTQFVVITHNRRTMEAATAIYGLTLENRCETRLLSMRLPDELGDLRTRPT